MDHVLTTPELRRSKLSRADFPALARTPITVVLDDVRGSYNLGAIVRLCDAFLCEQLVICGVPVAGRNRKFVQAAKGAQHWVPWREEPEAAAVVRAAKTKGHWIGVVELTAESVDVTAIEPRYPAYNEERYPVLRCRQEEVVRHADQAKLLPCWPSHQRRTGAGVLGGVDTYRGQPPSDADHASGRGGCPAS